MDPNVSPIEEVPGDAPVDEAPDVPFLFGCSLWIPTFAVILYVMIRLFVPRPISEKEEEEE